MVTWFVANAMVFWVAVDKVFWVLIRGVLGNCSQALLGIVHCVVGVYWAFAWQLLRCCAVQGVAGHCHGRKLLHAFEPNTAILYIVNVTTANVTWYSCG